MKLLKLADYYKPSWIYHPTHLWLGARLQYTQCISIGDTALLHSAMDMSHTQLLILSISYFAKFIGQMKNKDM